MKAGASAEAKLAGGLGQAGPLCGSINGMVEAVSGSGVDGQEWVRPEVGGGLGTHGRRPPGRLPPARLPRPAAPPPSSPSTYPTWTPLGSSSRPPQTTRSHSHHTLLASLPTVAPARSENDTHQLGETKTAHATRCRNSRGRRMHVWRRPCATQHPPVRRNTMCKIPTRSGSSCACWSARLYKAHREVEPVCQKSADGVRCGDRTTTSCRTRGRLWMRAPVPPPPCCKMCLAALGRQERTVLPRLRSRSLASNTEDVEGACLRYVG